MLAQERDPACEAGTQHRLKAQATLASQTLLNSLTHSYEKARKAR